MSAVVGCVEARVEQHDGLTSIGGFIVMMRRCAADQIDA